MSPPVGARLRLAVGSRDGSAAIIEENEEMHYLQTLNYLSFTTPVSAFTPLPLPPHSRGLPHAELGSPLFLALLYLTRPCSDTLIR